MGLWYIQATVALFCLFISLTADSLPFRILLSALVRLTAKLGHLKNIFGN